ncbi:MAG: hypothetical protein R3221_10405 [Spongiibacter sp.]|nr:hypothetical protein [Spongiibacter sp.]
MKKIIKTMKCHSIKGTFLTVLLVYLFAPGIAVADRCADKGQGDWACSHNSKVHYYWCNGYLVGRAVRWQIPEGTPPPGGWPVAFYYAGTQYNTSSHAFARDADEVLGLVYETRMIHELLDDPMASGKQYAVFVPDPPATSGYMQYWHTNVVYPYSASCDYDFFNDFFDDIENNQYGSSSLYNMDQRYAYGLSSGGYNTSRMAVTFNSGSMADVWQSLAVIAASYATCAGWQCTVPNALPANHPPTKFWHGSQDSVVPISTMREYYDELVEDGFTTEKLEGVYDHELTSDVIGSFGVKAWFDQFWP